MPAPKGKGIADDADSYSDLGSGSESGSPPPLKRPPSQKKGKGIAEDADAFADLVDETTDKARTLESDWLYQLNGQVFGPVKPRDLLELLYDGKIDKDTPIAISDGEFAPLNRYGVFRVHLPKVENRKIEIQAVHLAEEAAAKARVKKRITWVVFALVVAAPVTYGIVRYIRHLKEEAARAEARVKEEALLKEVDTLMASVTIEPPLVDLTDDDKPDDNGAKKKRRRAVAKFSGSAGKGVVGEGGTGELTRTEIMSGIARVFGGFKRCIVEQIQRDPESVPEQIVLTFAIDNEGAVQNVSLGDRTLRQSPLRPCMAGQLGEVRYRKFKGEVQNVEYPITIGRQ
jgi:hypothetical protein